MLGAHIPTGLKCPSPVCCRCFLEKFTMQKDSAAPLLQMLHSCDLNWDRLDDCVLASGITLLTERNDFSLTL